MTEVERELNHLRFLLMESRNWDWVSYRDTIETPDGRAEAEKCFPALVALDAVITSALKGN